MRCSTGVVFLLIAVYDWWTEGHSFLLRSLDVAVADLFVCGAAFSSLITWRLLIDEHE